ncbi:Vitamin B12 transporter BtuB [Sinobacterium norvegicum]|uniref:Vitamin B12 transporter BtuB n=1 Tax=Sinobacterium norvegicum TaxID=1641715 RepID=A0ABM9AHM8_9GAMM|nr:TonB-dependent receptor [Sinobacterium norvegicum]CAH0992729.1 Vitamin B12 transporter BtuB [Sinobacterium norvegicum]
MQFNKKIIAQSVAIASLSGLSLQAFSQETSLMLEEVVVTAQKRAESIQDTPISIAAFDEQSIEDRGITNVTDLQSNVPNLQLTPHPNSATTTRAFMRGVGNNDDQITIDPSVAVYIDGVYMARSQGLSMETGDIERVEVLRGPQGSLYGRNATGGAINFITAAPDLEQFGFKQQLTAGSDNLLYSKTAINAPLSDNLAAKITYVNTQKDGFVENLGTGADHFGDQDRDALRLDVLWQPTEDLSIRYGYDNSNIADSPVYIVPTGTPGNNVDRPTQGSPFVSGLQNNDVSIDGNNLTVDWYINDSVQLKSITAYRELDSYTYQDFMTGINPLAPTEPLQTTATNTQQDQFSQEIQLLGEAFDSRLEYIVGGYFFKETATGRDQLNIPVAQAGITDVEQLRNTNITNTAYAVFAQGTYTPNILEERLHITAGLRWSEDQREADTAFNTTADNGNTDFGGWASKGDNTFNDFSPSLIAAYDLTDDVNVYGKVGTGYKAGGFSVRSSTPEVFSEGFAPETLISYELGLKSQLFDNRLRLNAAAFWADYEDIQVAIQTQGRYNDVSNAGKATIRGLELDATALITTGLTAVVSYGYLDAQYDEVIDSNGNDLTDQFVFINSPNNSYNAALDYAFPTYNWGSLSANLSYSYQDEKYTKAENDAYVIDAYGLLNARISLADIPVPSGELRTAIWGKNLQDTEYYVAHFQAGFPPGAVFGDPRSFGVDVIYEY